MPKTSSFSVAMSAFVSTPVRQNVPGMNEWMSGGHRQAREVRATPARDTCDALPSSLHKHTHTHLTDLRTARAPAGA